MTMPAFAQQQPTWPPNTIPRFVVGCAGFHKELIAPCRCTIDGVMKEFSLQDFMTLSNAGTIKDDARYRRITTDCGTRARMVQ